MYYIYTNIFYIGRIYMSERYLDGDGGEEEVEGVRAHTRHALGAAGALQQREELRDRACRVIYFNKDVTNT